MFHNCVRAQFWSFVEKDTTPEKMAGVGGSSLEFTEFVVPEG
jgi:hypothetical protein